MTDYPDGIERMDDNRPFPIQGELSGGRWGRCPACSIPWWLAEEVYAEYVRHFGRGQSLERIAERGGFGRGEVLLLLKGKNPCRDRLG